VDAILDGLTASKLYGGGGDYMCVAVGIDLIPSRTSELPTGLGFVGCSKQWSTTSYNLHTKGKSPVNSFPQRYITYSIMKILVEVFAPFQIVSGGCLKSAPTLTPLIYSNGFDTGQQRW
jgi:hypothetical protein